MIISRTPVRVSFAGGGTDNPDYYMAGCSAVTSSTIRKYMYVTFNKRFDVVRDPPLPKRLQEQAHLQGGRVWS